MNRSPMTKTHQANSPFVWPLEPHQAVTLGADPATRSFCVHEGRVWLTRQCDQGTPADVWLDAGQSHTLPAQTEWVAEAWPQARVSVVQAAPAVLKGRPLPTWLLPWRAVSSSAWQRA
jgi:hypothetical protein